MGGELGLEIKKKKPVSLINHAKQAQGANGGQSMSQTSCIRTANSRVAVRPT